MTTDQPNALLPKPRDFRLDFFRGIALLLIFIAHVPNNWLAEYRPGSFGFSDSADIFVFVSGYAAALAYAKIFRRKGFLVGCARVIKRCAELYAGHLGLFFAVVAIMLAGNRLLNTDTDYIRLLNLGYFFEHPEDALYGLFTMTYVPNYFDILPMYLVVLAMLPPLMLLDRVHPMLAPGVCIALYLSVPAFGLELPAEVAFERPWFFNPFSWQLLFYTGFFIGLGRVKPPAHRRWITVFCVSLLVLSIPLAHYPTYSRVDWLETARTNLEFFVDKTDLGILRWLHFLCLVYLATLFFSGKRQKLLHTRSSRAVIKAGQQALPVFLVGMALSHLTGMILDVSGRSVPKVIVVNAAAIAFLIFAGYSVAWFKSQPWKNLPALQSPSGSKDRVLGYEGKRRNAEG